MADEQTGTIEADAPAGPALLAIGATRAEANGLELTVLGIDRAPRTDDAPATASTRLLVRVRVRNAADEPREFENNFGIVDHTGAVHRRVWANPDRYTDALAGVAMVEPGAALEGVAHVLVPGADDIPTAALRAAYLIAVTGCGGCDQGVMLYPVAVWQDAS